MLTTKSKVENFLDTSISEDLVDKIAWVSAFITNYTEKDFEAGVAESKYYDGDGTDTLLIDDVTSVTQVDIIDSQAVSEVEYTLDNTNDYWLYPLNKTVFNTIKINPAGARGIFPVGHHRIKVTGVFAFSATVPADIEWVATSMVAELYKMKDDSTRVISSETLGEYSVTFEKLTEKPSYVNILNFYRTPNV